MRVAVVEQIDAIDRTAWNAVSGTANPFTRHEFLAALEHNDCLGEKHGWLPRHLAVYADDGSLAAVAPHYAKYNSYGEFVFDWAWADAWQRSGLDYYPKGLVAIPYTPAAGPRLMTRPDLDYDTLAVQLVKLGLSLAEREGWSSSHWLFTGEADTRLLKAQGLLLRLDCQFHWHNAGYPDFEDFLATLKSRKRKKIRHERDLVAQTGIAIRTLHGGDVDDALWPVIHDFYRTTFERKWGHPTLTEGFFREVGETMGEQLVLFVAFEGDTPIAGAICFRGDDTLYGRHWGAYRQYPGLHFETCFYQGIDYCINNGLARFEPGAQGEHKISRGFLPTPTWSAHWIAEPRFRDAIARFLVQETAAMEDYIGELRTQSPYRDTDGND
jgi:predicted N-acyltransferase